ncbi:UNVERIFIED_CONTAM: hypothetical protein FKN15_004252 [Acipenser sinensis]
MSYAPLSSGEWWPKSLGVYTSDAVGKTSLITRFMYDSFDNTYQVGHSFFILSEWGVHSGISVKDFLSRCSLYASIRINIRFVSFFLIISQVGLPLKPDNCTIQLLGFQQRGVGVEVQVVKGSLKATVMLAYHSAMKRMWSQEQHKLYEQKTMQLLYRCLVSTLLSGPGSLHPTLDPAFCTLLSGPGSLHPTLDPAFCTLLSGPCAPLYPAFCTLLSGPCAPLYPALCTLLSGPCAPLYPALCTLLSSPYSLDPALCTL